MNSDVGNIGKVSFFVRACVQLIPLALLLNCAIAMYAEECSVYPDISFYLLQTLSFPMLLICWYQQKKEVWEGCSSGIVKFIRVFRLINALLFVLHIVLFVVGIHTIRYAGPLTFARYLY